MGGFAEIYPWTAGDRHNRRRRGLGLLQYNKVKKYAELKYRKRYLLVLSQECADLRKIGDCNDKVNS